MPIGVRRATKSSNTSAPNAAVEDKQPHLDHALAGYDLVVGAAPGGIDENDAATIHSSRQIVSFYKRCVMAETDDGNHRVARGAESTPRLPTDHRRRRGQVSVITGQDTQGVARSHDWRTVR